VIGRLLDGCRFVAVGSTSGAGEIAAGSGGVAAEMWQNLGKTHFDVAVLFSQQHARIERRY